MIFAIFFPITAHCQTRSLPQKIFCSYSKKNIVFLTCNKKYSLYLLIIDRKPICTSYMFILNGLISGLQTDLKQLDGLALLDLDVRPQVIWYFPESDLSEDIIERIKTLFRLKEKWTLDEIRPYVE